MIIIDIHEPLDIKYKLENLGMQCEHRSIQVGDYLIGDCLIERKTVKDFLQSIYSGRLYNQLSNLKDSSNRPILIVEGDYPKVKYKFGRTVCMSDTDFLKMRKTVTSNILVSYLSFHIPVLRTKSIDETVYWLSQISFRLNTSVAGLKPIQRKSKSLFDIKSDIFACIPGIGRSSSNALAKKYSIKNIIDLPEETLSNFEIDGRKIGIRAKKIKEALTS